MPAYKEKNGTWTARFYYDTPTGERLQKKKRGFATKKAAQEYERIFLSETHFDNKTTFAQAAETYIKDKQPRLKAVTIRHYKNVLGVVLPIIGNVPLSKFSNKTIIYFQNALLAKDIKPSTVRDYENLTRAIFSHAVKIYGVSNNPFDKIKGVGEPASQSLRFWTLEQYKGFRAWLGSDLLNLCGFDLLFYTGMRSGELRGLCFQDIDTTGEIVHINKTLQRVNRETITTAPKTKKSNRSITLPTFLASELAELRSRLYGSTPNTAPFELFTADYLRNKLKAYCNETGEAYINPHGLRHSHAALLIERGFDVYTISERLGHTTPTMTLNTYGHLYPNKQKAVAVDLDKLALETANPAGLNLGLKEK